MAPPFGPLKYLYMGSKDFPQDLRYYREVLGADLVWNFHAFDAHVAAFRLGAGPLVLIADHRPPRTCIPVFAVNSLRGVAKDLKKRGWAPRGDAFGIPDGPCYLFEDPSGNEIAFFENARPDALIGEYDPERDPMLKRAKD